MLSKRNTQSQPEVTISVFIRTPSFESEAHLNMETENLAAFSPDFSWLSPAS